MHVCVVIMNISKYIHLWKRHVNLISQSFRSVSSDFHQCIIINTDEDPSLRIESFAIRGVSTNYALIYCPTVLDVTSWPCSNTVLDDVGPMCSPHLNKTEESASGSLRITSLIDDHVAQLPVRENQSTRQGVCRVLCMLFCKKSGS